jgi:TRAP transporter TAXI family solute receptor
VAACGLLVWGATATAQERDDWPELIRLATASLGGTYHIYGHGLAARITDKLGVLADTRATGGPYHNMTLIHTGEAELGFVTLGPARELWEGEAEFADGEKMRHVRALFPMYRTPFHVVTQADSGIESIDDLSGARVGVGPMGGTCATYWERFFEALGVENVRLQYAGASLSADYVLGGLSDAFAFCGGLPIQAFEHVERRQEVQMFGMTEEQQATLVDAFPVTPYEIPADTYASMDSPQASVAFWNFAIGHKDLDEGFVHELMALVLEDNGAMQEIHPAAAETRLEHMDKNNVIWFHPGAVRYYREQGLEVAEAMLPPAMRQDEEEGEEEKAETEGEGEGEGEEEEGAQQ